MSEEGMGTSIVISDEFKQRVREFKAEWRKKYKAISKEKTPQVDGSGRRIIERRPDGFDFIIEAYMRECLDKHFPGWSWDMGGPPVFLGSEWVIVWGTLGIIDEMLIPMGVSPPIRRFSATNGVRIKFKSGKPHLPENVIDVGNDVASANSKAFKKAINQLTHIGDDIYGKRIEEEGAGSLEDVALASNDATAFGRWIAGNKLTFGEVMKVLGVSSMNEITDFQGAIRKVKEAKGWK